MAVRRFSTSSIKTGTKTSKFWDQSTVLTSFESIATVSVGSGGAATIDFTSIPATYTHLQIRAISRDTRAVSTNTNNMRVGNGSIDTGNNYATHYFDGDGSATYASWASSYSSMAYMIEPSANATANTFGALIIDILDYANTNKYKTFRFIGGCDINGTGGQIGMTSGVWMNTAAITDIRFFNNANSNYAQYTHYALYGIKGA